MPKGRSKPSGKIGYRTQMVLKIVNRTRPVVVPAHVGQSGLAIFF
ncbi:MAG: hypothetical protein ACT4PN_16960 [Nitrospiraceae bacterium]